MTPHSKELIFVMLVASVFALITPLTYAPDFYPVLTNVFLESKNLLKGTPLAPIIGRYCQPAPSATGPYSSITFPVFHVLFLGLSFLQNPLETATAFYAVVVFLSIIISYYGMRQYLKTEEGENESKAYSLIYATSGPFLALLNWGAFETFLGYALVPWFFYYLKKQDGQRAGAIVAVYVFTGNLYFSYWLALCVGFYFLSNGWSRALTRLAAIAFLAAGLKAALMFFGGLPNRVRPDAGYSIVWLAEYIIKTLVGGTAFGASATSFLPGFFFPILLLAAFAAFKNWRRWESLALFFFILYLLSRGNPLFFLYQLLPFLNTFPDMGRAVLITPFLAVAVLAPWLKTVVVRRRLLLLNVFLVLGLLVGASGVYDAAVSRTVIQTEAISTFNSLPSNASFYVPSRFDGDGLVEYLLLNHGSRIVNPYDAYNYSNDSSCFTNTIIKKRVV